MATLPEIGNISLRDAAQTVSQPSLTFWVNPASSSISGTADGLDAVKQAVEIILNIQRFRYEIYTPNVGMDYRGLIGGGPGLAATDLLRRLREAFSADDRILGVEDFEYTVQGNSLSASFVVRTVFGDLAQTAEVMLG